MSEVAQGQESYGVLVGWDHNNYTGRVDLKLQCVKSTRRDDAREIDDHHIVMTPSQAAVLANYLYQVSGHTPPTPKRGLLRRLLG